GGCFELLCFVVAAVQHSRKLFLSKYSSCHFAAISGLLFVHFAGLHFAAILLQDVAAILSILLLYSPGAALYFLL
ncbi:hypothetical protein U1Q18_001059, partial [Sarracenia purpurea var. burkii]